MTERAITDCGEDGCGECDTCLHYDHLEWVWQASAGVPSSYERGEHKETTDGE